MSAVIEMPIGRASARSSLSRSDVFAETPLTAKQKSLIRESFLKLEPAMELVGQAFYLKLFQLDSTLQAKFAGPAEARARKFAAAMKLGMITLGHEDGLAPTLKLLGARHRQLGIKARDYRTMARALMWTLEQSLQKSFKRQTRDAWTALLGQLTRVLSR